MSAVAASDWIAKAETIQPRNEAFIDGRYVPAASGRTYDDIAGRDGRDPEGLRDEHALRPLAGALRPDDQEAGGAVRGSRHRRSPS